MSKTTNKHKSLSKAALQCEVESSRVEAASAPGKGSQVPVPLPAAPPLPAVGADRR